MRPPSVYAKRPCPAGDPCDVLGLLHGPHRVGCRLVMILLSQHGCSAAQIASLLACDPCTVRRWIHRYHQHGVDGLSDRPRAGRPRLGSPRLGERIVRLLAEPKAWTIGRLWKRLGRPAMSLRTLHRRVGEVAAWRRPRLGSPRLGDRIGRLLAQPRAWTIGLLHRYLGHPAISLHTLHRRVREVAAWRRPRLVAKGDPDRDQVLADLHQQLNQLPKGAVVLAEDETHVNLLPWVRSTWIAKGCRQRVMTPGTNRRRTIFGAVDLHSGRFLYQVCRKAVSANFTTFCEQLLAAYPTAPLVAVVCDNVIIHHSKIVQAWLASHPRMRVLHGARYSPHDNPVERIWGALKAYLANSPTPTMAGRIRQVHAFFRARSPAQLLVTAAPHSSPWLPDRYGQNIQEAA